MRSMLCVCVWSVRRARSLQPGCGAHVNAGTNASCWPPGADVHRAGPEGSAGHVSQPGQGGGAHSAGSAAGQQGCSHQLSAADGGGALTSENTDAPDQPSNPHSGHTNPTHTQDIYYICIYPPSQKYLPLERLSFTHMDKHEVSDAVHSKASFTCSRVWGLQQLTLGTPEIRAFSLHVVGQQTSPQIWVTIQSVTSRVGSWRRLWCVFTAESRLQKGSSLSLSSLALPLFLL